MALADTAKLIAALELKDQFSDRIGHAERALAKFDKGFDSVNTRSKKFGTQIGVGILRTAAIGVAAVGTFATVFTKATFLASDLNETVSKVGVVFGKQSGQVLTFGKTSAAALGLSENAADSAAATYGNLFVSMGLAQKKSADMSVSLVKLAGDLASLNNIDPAEALDKLRAGLTGESEPLKTLGININEQTLKAKALELGLVKLAKGQKNYTAVLDPATKAQAAYALIFEQSKTAQGDFARTSGGLANQIRILKANFTNLGATLATASLPQIAKIFQAINKEISGNGPAIERLGTSIAGLFSDENIRTGTELIKNTFATIREAAPILEATAKSTFEIVKAAVGVFRSLPPEIQKLAVGAFAVNKLTGGLVTNIAGGIVEAVGKNVFQRGATPANPLFVADVTGGLGGAGAAAGGAGLLGKLGTLITKVGGLALVVGGLAGIGAGTSIGGPAGAGIGALGGAAAIGGGALLAGPVGAIIAAVAATGKTLLDIRDQSAHQGQDIAASIQGEIAGGASLADLQKSLAAVNTGINEIQANPLNVLLAGDALDQLRAQRSLLEQQIHSGPATGTEQNPGKLADDLATAIPFGLIKGFNRIGLIALLKTLPTTIAKATKKEDVAKAVAKAVETFVTRKQGNASDTRALLSALREKLGKTHDPKLQEALRSAIAKVERKLPGREFAARSLTKADKILHSNESTGKKINDLKTIERALRDHGLPTIARKVQHMEGKVVGQALPEVGKKVGKVATAVAAAQRAQVIASHGTTEAIKDKDLSVTVNTSLTSSVSIQGVFREQRKINRYTTIS